jgi:hypothetical protein
LDSGAGGIDSAATWTDSGAVNIANSGTVTDADDTTLASMTASLGVVHTGDVLAATATGNITVNYDSGTGVLTLSGVDTLANYQTVLNSITYDNTNGGPGVGSKTVTVVANDGAGGLSAAAVSTITISLVGPGSTVAGRHIFYNQSFYDGNNAGIQATVGGANNDDEDARDFSLNAYLPGGGAASELNISSYDKGINGIMIDLSTGVDHSGLTLANVANNFIFKVGNNNTPSGWAVAPAPNALSMTPGGGVGGSDRVTITWANGTIINKWLEVGVLPTAQTGLAASALTVDPDGPGAGTAVAAGDVFFFGNARGDGKVGNTATGVTVDANDELVARNNPKSPFSPATVDNDHDYNKDKLVDPNDQLIARNNPISPFSPVRKINIGTAGPLAPEGDEGDSGIASALASTATTSTAHVGTSDLPPGIAHRLEGLDLNSGRIASFFQHLADQDTPGTRKILTKIDAVADELGLDHELLDSLLVDLGLE